MKIEEALKEIAASALPEMSFCLGTMTEIDEKLDLLKPPFMWVVFPTSGAFIVRHGMLKERLRALVGFFDLVERDADGEDNMAVYRRMAGKAATFIDAVNHNRHLAPLDTTIPMTIHSEVGAANVTGLILEVEFTEAVGECL